MPSQWLLPMAAPATTHTQPCLSAPPGLVSRYSPDCEGLCGGHFYVQYYGILGLLCFIGLMIPRG